MQYDSWVGQMATSQSGQTAATIVKNTPSRAQYWVFLGEMHAQRPVRTRSRGNRKCLTVSPAHELSPREPKLRGSVTRLPADLRAVRRVGAAVAEPAVEEAHGIEATHELRVRVLRRDVQRRPALVQHEGAAGGARASGSAPCCVSPLGTPAHSREGDHLAPAARSISTMFVLPAVTATCRGVPCALVLPAMCLSAPL